MHSSTIGPIRRAGTFEPQLVAKRQTRLAGLDEKILDLYAGGMSVRDIESHLQRLYGTTALGRDTISRVTDAVLADVQAWRTRPLERVYPIVYLDALMVKVREDRSVRTRACYLAIGVTVDGEREVLGLWWQETEGAKFWLAVVNDLHHRGVEDVLVACVDGLTGFPEAIEAVFPQAWVQTSQGLLRARRTRMLAARSQSAPAPARSALIAGYAGSASRTIPGSTGTTPSQVPAVPSPRAGTEVCSGPAGGQAPARCHARPPSGPAAHSGSAARPA